MNISFFEPLSKMHQGILKPFVDLNYEFREENVTNYSLYSVKLFKSAFQKFWVAGNILHL